MHGQHHRRRDGSQHHLNDVEQEDDAGRPDQVAQPAQNQSAGKKPESRDPDLVRILPDMDVARLDTWIVTHENLARVPRVRAVFDSLVASFRALSKER